MNPTDSELSVTSTQFHAIGQSHTMEGSSSLLLRDRFELLSAYLDGELTAPERQQVEHWLDKEPDVQCLYRRLLTLRQGLQTLPEPVAAIAPDRLVQGVFAGVDHQRRQRWLWRMGPVAAAVVGVCTGLWLTVSGRSPLPQFAEEPQPVPTVVTPKASLAISLDQPIIEFDFAETEALPAVSPGAISIPATQQNGAQPAPVAP